MFLIFPTHIFSKAISADMDYGGEKPLHVTLIPNPSHLEAQDPVACGKTRAKQLRSREGHYSNDPNSQCGDKVSHERVLE